VRILIVTATAPEVARVAARLHRSSVQETRTRVSGYTFAGHDVDILHTGVGMVATAAWCARVLTERRYDFAMNLGVCGSFDRAFAPGAVVHVATDRIAELGAEDGDGFLAFQDLGLPGDCEFTSPATHLNAAIAGLPAVRGITVNTVHGNERSIAAVVERFHPQVESMEGAAFMYACQIHDVPFAQVRAVSNIVEKRNRQAWQIPEAIENLGRAALRVLEAA
jgi:futalosine hydrolase